MDNMELRDGRWYKNGSPLIGESQALLDAFGADRYENGAFYSGNVRLSITPTQLVTMGESFPGGDGPTLEEARAGLAGEGEVVRGEVVRPGGIPETWQPLETRTDDQGETVTVWGPPEEAEAHGVSLEEAFSLANALSSSTNRNWVPTPINLVGNEWGVVDTGPRITEYQTRQLEMQEEQNRIAQEQFNRSFNELSAYQQSQVRMQLAQDQLAREMFERPYAELTEYQRQQLELQSQPQSYEEVIIRAVEERTPEGWQRAQALFDFQNQLQRRALTQEDRRLQMEAFDRAYAYATSPADQIMLMRMMYGEEAASEGARLPRSPLVEQAAQGLFGRRMGAGEEIPARFSPAGEDIVSLGGGRFAPSAEMARVIEGTPGGVQQQAQQVRQLSEQLQMSGLPLDERDILQEELKFARKELRARQARNLERQQEGRWRMASEPPPAGFTPTFVGGGGAGVGASASLPAQFAKAVFSGQPFERQRDIATLLDMPYRGGPEWARMTGPELAAMEAMATERGGIGAWEEWLRGQQRRVGQFRPRDTASFQPRRVFGGR